MDDEFGAPLTEGLAGLALPVDPADVALELASGVLDGGLRVQESSGRGLQVLRFRGLDHVDHGVQVVALEVRCAKDAGELSAEGEEPGHPRHTVRYVDAANLLSGLLSLRLVRVLVLLLVAH
ncbi:hypothetical protein [Streptomyces pseudoechinosporeus]